MKKPIIHVFTFLFVAGSFIANVNAQEQAQSQVSQQHQSKMSPEQRIEKRLNKMKVELNLTDEQMPKVKAVLMARENMREQKAGGGNPQAAKENHKQMMNDLSKILTPEQMTKFNQMKAQGKNKTQGNSSNENVPAK